VDPSENQFEGLNAVHTARNEGRASQTRGQIFHKMVRDAPAPTLAFQAT